MSCRKDFFVRGMTIWRLCLMVWSCFGEGQAKRTSCDKQASKRWWQNTSFECGSQHQHTLYNYSRKQRRNQSKVFSTKHVPRRAQHTRVLAMGAHCMDEAPEGWRSKVSVVSAVSRYFLMFQHFVSFVLASSTKSSRSRVCWRFISCSSASGALSRSTEQWTWDGGGSFADALLFWKRRTTFAKGSVSSKKTYLIYIHLSSQRPTLALPGVMKHQEDQKKYLHRKDATPHEYNI